MSNLSDVCRRHPFARFRNAVRHKRISYRFLVLSAATFLTLYTFYWSNIKRSLPFSERPPSRPTPPEVWADRADKVRSAFIHAYRGYERYAAPHDELRPVSNRVSDRYVLYYGIFVG